MPSIFWLRTFTQSLSPIDFKYLLWGGKHNWRSSMPWGLIFQVINIFIRSIISRVWWPCVSVYIYSSMRLILTNECEQYSGKLRVRFLNNKFVSTLFLTFRHHWFDLFKELFKIISVYRCVYDHRKKTTNISYSKSRPSQNNRSFFT